MSALEGYVEGMINLSGGGGGGTSDYEELENKPSINGVTLSGNKTTSDLNLSYNDLLNKPYINNMPPSTGTNIGDVLTHTSDGDEWAAPAKELPAISAADEGKALIASNGVAAWGNVASINYSENEEIIGKWIDNKNVYQITLVLSGVVINTTRWITVNINNYVQNIKYIIHYDAVADDGTNTHDITGVFSEVQPYQSDGNQMLDLHSIIATNRTLKYLTLQYTKTTE